MVFQVDVVLLAKHDPPWSGNGDLSLASDYQTLPSETTNGVLQLGGNVRELVVGRAIMHGIASDQSDVSIRVEVPATSGFGDLMPNKAMVFEAIKPREGSPWELFVSCQASQPGWRLVIGAKAVKPLSPPARIQANEQVRLQLESSPNQWEDVMDAYVTSTEDTPSVQALAPTTDPLPLWQRRQEAVANIKVKLFGPNPKEWGEWAQAIAAITILCQRPRLFEAYPHLRLEARARGKWLQAVMSELRGPLAQSTQFWKPPAFSHELTKAMGLGNYTVHEVFPMPDLDIVPAQWYDRATKTLIGHSVVTPEIMMAIAECFPMVEDRLRRQQR